MNSVRVDGANADNDVEPMSIKLPVYAPYVRERLSIPPDVPARQWVLSVPFELGLLLACHGDAFGAISSLFDGAHPFQKFPGTTWANDITEHLLINPGTHPAERGYGKKYELE